MTRQVITVRKLNGIWEDAGIARNEVAIATSPGRLNEINAVIAAYGIETAFDLVESNVLSISRDWTEEGWAEYQSRCHLDPADYLDSGLEVSESVA